jgi:hypothetical protein
VVDELIPTAGHHVERSANNPIESDHAAATTSSVTLRLTAAFTKLTAAI